jgi:hypothetical protein
MKVLIYIPISLEYYSCAEVAMMNLAVELAKRGHEIYFVSGDMLSKEPRVVTIHHLAYLVAQVTSPLKRLLDIFGETAFTHFIQK